jgi:hypothetical protein
LIASSCLFCPSSNVRFSLRNYFFNAPICDWSSLVGTVMTTAIQNFQSYHR